MKTSTKIILVVVAIVMAMLIALNQIGINAENAYHKCLATAVYDDTVTCHDPAS